MPSVRGSRLGSLTGKFFDIEVAGSSWGIIDKIQKIIDNCFWRMENYSKILLQCSFTIDSEGLGYTFDAIFIICSVDWIRFKDIRTMWTLAVLIEKNKIHCHKH